MHYQMLMAYVVNRHTTIPDAFMTIIIKPVRLCKMRKYCSDECHQYLCLIAAQKQITNYCQAL